jgi:hypothetical protein
LAFDDEACAVLVPELGLRRGDKLPGCISHSG